jgi:hypothetical protein
LPLPCEPLAVTDAVAALDHLSMQDRLDQGGFTAEELDLLNPVLATYCSAPCSDGALTAIMRWFSLPGWDFGLMLDAVGIYGLRTASLVEALATDSRSEVRLSTPVAAIEQRDQRVTVTARDGQAFLAPAVVVAVPLNTLSTIDFTPALPSEKQTVADRGQASRGVKLWAHVRGDLEPFFFMAPDDHPITFLVTETVLDDGSQLLVAFGPDAERLPPGNWHLVMAATGHDWWPTSQRLSDRSRQREVHLGDRQRQHTRRELADLNRRPSVTARIADLHCCGWWPVRRPHPGARSCPSRPEGLSDTPP